MSIYTVPIVAVVLTLWGVAIYNKLVKFRNLVEEGWSGIDVQLKRRANLIPNLIEAVKGYMGHERGVLDEITELRTRSLNDGAPGERSATEGLLGAALGKLFAVAEAYPDLKASDNFQELQAALAEIEEQIQLSRRYYNGCVRNLNVAIEQFPSNLIAKWFGFRQAEFFELEDPAERAVPEVKFD